MHNETLTVTYRGTKISSELRSSGSKEDIKETKIVDSVLLSLFMCSNVMVKRCPHPVASA